MASHYSDTAYAYWNCTRCGFRMGRMMWLILFILIAAYIVADRKKILMEINELWKRMK